MLDIRPREPAVRPQPRRRRTLAALAAVCLVALLGVFLYFRVFHAASLPLAYRGQDTLNDDLTQVVTDPSGGLWAVGLHYGKPLSENPLQLDSTFLLHFEQGTWVKVYVLPTSGFVGIARVAMLSPHEGWAVGQANGSGLILHYQDGSGRQQPVHVAGVGGLWDVAMVSADDGWAVGENGTILHYTAGSWSTGASPTTSSLSSIAMVSADDGWAVGDIGESGFILRYTHGRWTEVSSPADAFLTSITMVSADEGWAVGNQFNTRSVIWHYTAGTWQTMSIPTSQPLESVAAVSASDVWAVGREGTLLHYNGATWSLVNGPN